MPYFWLSEESAPPGPFFDDPFWLSQVEGGASLVLSAPAVAYDGTDFTITATSNFDLSLGRFGFAATLDGGVEQFFDGAGDVAGAQELIVTKAFFESILGTINEDSIITIRVGYSLTDPADVKVYSSAPITPYVESVDHDSDVTPPFDVAALAIINACVTPPNEAAMAAIDAFVLEMKAATFASTNAWDICDEIFVPLYTGASADTDGDSRLNWKDPTGTKFAKVGTPNLAQVAGSLGKYTSAGSNDYLTSVANMDAMVNFQQNDAHISAYVISGAGEEAVGVVGAPADPNVSIQPRRATNICRFYVNAVSATSSSGTGAGEVTTGLGYWLAVRTGTNACEMWQDGTSRVTGTAVSSARLAVKHTICFGNFTDSTRGVSFASIGGSVSSVQAAVTAAVANLMAALQAAT